MGGAQETGRGYQARLHRARRRSAAGPHSNFLPVAAAWRRVGSHHSRPSPFPHPCAKGDLDAFNAVMNLMKSPRIQNLTVPLVTSAD